ncbi:unnamed protein product [Peronospora destructor]|uniref:Uncharacterized protein n=1 Tax=Peronospora destructor TaxID=86335 RepID=A0AAV0T221_9STRA|nr:unnamed protein product [Peronospora destructor]
MDMSAGSRNRLAESGDKSSDTKNNSDEPGEPFAESRNDVGHREEPGADSRKPTTRGKRGGQGKRTNAKATAETPRMTTRYGGKKPPPREIVGAIYRVDPANWNSAMKSDKRVE